MGCYIGGRVATGAGAIMTRKTHDYIAFGVHLVMLIVILVYVVGGRDDVYEQARLWLIFGVELISCAFHAWVVAGWYKKSDHRLLHKFWTETGSTADHWNWLKWAEYAVTATMGTISVGIKSARRVDSHRVAGLCVLLAIGGVAQQTSGYYIDKPDTSNVRRGMLWLGATAWQIVEFVVIVSEWGFKVSAGGPLFVVYASMWSVFGVIAAFRSLNTANVAIGGFFDLDVTETLYSAFGWMAKLAVAATTLADIVGNSNSQTTNVGYVFAVAVPLVVMAATFGAQYTAKRNGALARGGAYDVLTRGGVDARGGNEL